MHLILSTAILVSIFAVFYLYFTIRETARRRLDLYDLIMLSTVAIIPCIFVLFPAFAERIAIISGVAFPFVVMFGLLLVILFLLIHRLTAKIHKLECSNRLLVQEISIIKSEIIGQYNPTIKILGNNVVKG
ncbi:DUF2304 family protein [Polynucleobacter paneuropaeus]|jgi:hypothetical protein|nr:DUF2304 family protein [Polynucleobacter paneuropaeus]MBT8610779.1 DUF2304 family protein [Polynucleobacter paneuropaeus]